MRGGAVRLMGAVAAGAVLVALAPVAVRAEEPDLSRVPAAGGLRRAAQLAAAAVVEVDLDITGALRDAGGVGQHRHLGFSGSGFFASADGYVVSAAHVAAPTEEQIHRALVNAQVDQDHGCRRTTSDSCAAAEARYGPDLLASTTAVDLSTAVHVVMQTTTADSPGLDATVVTSSPSDVQDVAVLKVNVGNLPVLVIAGSNPAVGTAVVVEGYPESAQATRVPVVTTGVVQEVRGGDVGFAQSATVVGTDAHIEHGNSGGPGIDASGGVVGIVSYGPAVTSTSYMVSAADIAEVLSRTPARNQPGRIDQLWRDGLVALDRGDSAGAARLFRQCAALSSVQVGCQDEADRLAGHPTSPPLPRAVGAAALAAGDQTATLVDGILIGLVAGSVGTLLLTAAMRRRRRAQSALPAPWWGTPPPPVWPQHPGGAPWWPPATPPPEGQSPYAWPPAPPRHWQPPEPPVEPAPTEPPPSP